MSRGKVSVAYAVFELDYGGFVMSVKGEDKLCPSKRSFTAKVS
jgi:hypothetical protein